MNKLSKSEAGIGAVEALLIAVIVVIFGFVGWYVLKNKNKLNNANVPTISGATPKKTTTSSSISSQKTDPTANWQTYSNSKYGISYKYPATWATGEEVNISPANQDVTAAEFSTTLKLLTNTKYNETAVFEVLNKSLSNAVTYQDKTYAESPLNNVKKTSNTLKGKQSVQYDVTNSGVESKLYLFSVGAKTYSFASINESLNLQANTDYWTTFDEVFNTLKIN